MNILDFIKIEEDNHSKFLVELLKYTKGARYNNNSNRNNIKDFPFMNRFLDLIEDSCGDFKKEKCDYFTINFNKNYSKEKFNDKFFNDREGKKDATDKDYEEFRNSEGKIFYEDNSGGKIDILIELYSKDTENKNVIIIENKINGAEDQGYQIKRYLKYVYGFSLDFLSKNEEEKKENCIFEDYDKNKENLYEKESIFFIYLTMDGCKKPEEYSLTNLAKIFLDNRYIELNYIGKILPLLKKEILPNCRDKNMIDSIELYIEKISPKNNEIISKLNAFIEQSILGMYVNKYEAIIKIKKKVDRIIKIIECINENENGIENQNEKLKFIKKYFEKEKFQVDFVRNRWLQIFKIEWKKVFNNKFFMHFEVDIDIENLEEKKQKYNLSFHMEDKNDKNFCDKFCENCRLQNKNKNLLTKSSIKYDGDLESFLSLIKEEIKKIISKYDIDSKIKTFVEEALYVKECYEKLDNDFDVNKIKKYINILFGYNYEKLFVIRFNELSKTEDFIAKYYIVQDNIKNSYFQIYKKNWKANTFNYDIHFEFIGNSLFDDKKIKFFLDIETTENSDNLECFFYKFKEKYEICKNKHESHDKDDIENTKGKRKKRIRIKVSEDKNSDKFIDKLYETTKEIIDVIDDLLKNDSSYE